ncbi:MAG TPA: cytochrome c biogenesis protein CcsA [Chloroflexota bacterium]|nr:cytochrome c biogenesis protein CcsA [Chloroflexota bacterium]
MSVFWRVICGLGISAVIVAAFAFVPPAQGFRDPEGARIIFFHVPMAWLAVLGFLTAMVNAVRYLRTRRLEYDVRSVAGAEMGFLFCLLATVSGAIFAKIQWGTAWNWDPRETSIFVLLLIYGAYFALRSSVADDERRAALSAAYASLAVFPMLFLVFVLPRMEPGLHPSDTVRSGHMSPEYRAVFFAALFCFTLLFAWVYQLRTAVGRMGGRAAVAWREGL